MRDAARVRGGQKLGATLINYAEVIELIPDLMRSTGLTSKLCLDAVLQVCPESLFGTELFLEESVEVIEIE